jgi:hypothetical protein
MTAGNLPIIGRGVYLTIVGSKGVPAKVDTGADSSCVWASDVTEDDQGLHFVLFDRSSPYFTGDRLTVRAGDYEQVRIASSTGDRESRYKVALPVNIRGTEYIVMFSLADRTTMAYPILLGRGFLEGHFLVDVQQDETAAISEELLQQKATRIAANVPQSKGGIL